MNANYANTDVNRSVIWTGTFEAATVKTDRFNVIYAGSRVRRSQHCRDIFKTSTVTRSRMDANYANTDVNRSVIWTCILFATAAAAGANIRFN